MTDDSASRANFRHVMGSRVEEIASLADAFGRWAAGAGVPERAVGHVNLMLDELVTNVIEYGYRDSSGDVIVDAAVAGGALEVTITDHAFEHDPFQAAAPDLQAGIDERSVGGLGVHFVRTLADDARYERIDDGGRGANRVRIVKKF